MGHPAREPKSTDESVRATAAGESGGGLGCRREECDCRSFSGGGSLATNSDHSRTIGNCCPTSRTRSNIYHYIKYPCRRADIFGVRRLAAAFTVDKAPLYEWFKGNGWRRKSGSKLPHS